MANTSEYIAARDLSHQHLDRVISITDPRRGFALQGLICRITHQRGSEVAVFIELGSDVVTHHFDSDAQLTLLGDPEFTS